MELNDITHDRNSGKFKLLVDTMNEDGNFGVARDLEKIKHNTRLLDEEMGARGNRTNGQSTDYRARIFSAGRFISVVQSVETADASEMVFMDTSLNKEIFEEYIQVRFENDVATECLKVYDEIAADVEKVNDKFELYRTL